MGTYGYGVDPGDLGLELCEAYKQDHIEFPRVVHLFSAPAFRLIRSGREICPYITQHLELVCLA